MNTGKVFEYDFKESIPVGSLLVRIPDPPQSFTKRNDTKFSHKNPYDFVLYYGKTKSIYCLELKTTKYKSMSFEKFDSNDEDKKSNKMIHVHQINGLKKAKMCDAVNAGFLFNFRDEVNNMERTYYQDIDDFINMISSINKSSFNELDIILYNAIKIKGEKKRTRYKWDIDSFINNMAM